MSRVAACLASSWILFAGSAGALELSDLPACPSTAQTCIALDLWLPAGDDPASWLENQLEAANSRLAAIGAGVQVTQIHRLPSDLCDIATVTKRNRLGALGQQAPLRWFVVEHLADNADPRQVRKGVTWRSKGAFWVIEARTAWRWVLAHELGHVLGLPHSSEAASIMNKTPRVWPPPWKIGFTAKEQPVMRKTLSALLKSGQLRTVPL